MWTLWSYCKQRYASNDLKTQAQYMPSETRQSLAQKIVETLNTADVEDVEDGTGMAAAGDNVEQVLAQLQVELQQANQQLKQLQDKEEFLALRIQKYQSLLKQQDEHLQQMAAATQQQQQQATTNEQQQQQQEEHYQEKLQKQQQNKEALGKVLDVHLSICKNIKVCQRTIAALEQKEYELTNVTKQCREFLILAEEAEREQQMGVIVEDDDDDEHGLQLVEQVADAVENDSGPLAKEEPKPIWPLTAAGVDVEDPKANIIETHVADATPVIATVEDEVDVEASTMVVSPPMESSSSDHANALIRDSKRAAAPGEITDNS